MKKGYDKSTQTKNGPKRGYATVVSDMPRFKPQLNVNDRDLPAIKGWQIGSKHTLTVEVEVSRLSNEDYDLDNDGDTMHATLQVTSIGEQGKKLNPTVDDEDD